MVRKSLYLNCVIYLVKFKNMKRWDIINVMGKKYGNTDYLEIGLCSGICRDNVIAENKTTVDPFG